MNKKEIAEIRKQLKADRCALTRICGCYADVEKRKLAAFSSPFLSLEDEEIDKYLELFRKVLSGTLEKNMLNMEFPYGAEEEGGAQAFLMRLRESFLEDEDLVDEYFDKVIESCMGSDNLLILLVCGAYDVPGRAKDNIDMEDASDEVFSFMLSCVCPVKQSKPGLSYDAGRKFFYEQIREWVAQPPMLGFLFPAFNDRATDLHSVLYYSKNPEDLHLDFADAVLGCAVPPSPKMQHETFQGILQESMEESCDFETARGLHTALHALTEEKKKEPEAPVVHKEELRAMLAESGAAPQQLEAFETSFDESAGKGAAFLATNLMDTRRFEVRTPDIRIQVSADRADLIETQIIDGRPCLVIPINDALTVNGLPVKPPAAE